MKLGWSNAEKSWIPDFKLSPFSECCILSFGWFPGVWILYADVSEHSAPSIFIGRAEHEHDLWRWNRQVVPKRRHVKFRRRGITQKKEYEKVNCLWAHLIGVWWCRGLAPLRSQSRSACFGEEKTLLPLTRIEPRFLCRSGRNLVTIPTELTRFLNDVESFWTCATRPGEITNVIMN